MEIRFVFSSMTKALENGQGNDQETFSEFAYNSYIMLILGTLESSVIPAIPTSAFFLTLSRCIVVGLQKLSYALYEKILSSLSIFIGVAFACVNTFILLHRLPSDSSTSCWSFVCLTGVEYSVFFLSTKMVFGFLNIIFGLVFLYCLKISSKKFALVKYTAESIQERRKVRFFLIFSFKEHF